MADLQEWFIFGTDPDGSVDIADADGDVLHALPRDQAEAVIRSRNRLLKLCKELAERPRMTPEQRAQKIVDTLLNPASHGQGLRNQMKEEIRKAIVDASTDEVNRRREAEAQFQNLCAGGPIIIAEDNACYLRVYNPKTQSWWETAMRDTKAHF